LLSDIDVFEHAVELLLGDDRTHLRIFNSRSDRHLLQLSDQFFRKSLQHRPFDKMTHAGRADLAGIIGDNARSALGGGIEVGIGKYDEW